ncbi:MAG: dephospho-CoA kinase [Negativicutes bacterium]|nr:dephospho-CoA kinase [Negativicutes bacterium]
MYIIGLTGGIASGKSTVSKQLGELGAYVVDADQIARDIVQPGEPAWKEIQRQFGPEILLADGSINRKKLGEIVFSDSEAREKLNRITHPRIELAALQAIEKAKAEGYNIAVLDVPLLIESGWQRLVDAVWVVYTDRETQLLRLMNRDNLTREAALSRIRSQMSLDEKKNYADIVIDNSGGHKDTRRQVLAAWKAIL